MKCKGKYDEYNKWNFKQENETKKGNSQIPSPFFSSSNNFSFRAMASTFQIVTHGFLGWVRKLAKVLLLS